MTKRKRQSTLEEAGMVKRLKPAPAAPRPEAPPPKRASLLDLPGELRNQIFEHVIEDACTRMHSSDLPYVRVCSIDFERPAICRVNRQLRNETLDLFNELTDHYGGLDVEVVDLKFGPQLGHFVWRRQPQMLLLRSNSWANLKGWLRLYSVNRKVPVPATFLDDFDDNAQNDVLRGAFAMVAKFVDAGMSWTVVESVLEDFKIATQGVYTNSGDEFWGL